jgi:imidazoleglycerol-phosphate dehydratase/histidinol-phosphatase
MRKIAFLDRDGTLIFEPQDTFQVDSVDQLQILPGVIENLQLLLQNDYQLVMVTNQDGLGTESNPYENFYAVQNKLLEILERKGISFFRIFICPHFPKDNCACRKPKLGMIEKFLAEEPIDLSDSLMVGDRETDRQFAENIGVRCLKMDTNGHFPNLM